MRFFIIILFWLGCIYWADFGASAAIYTYAGIYYIFTVGIGNAIDWAFVNAGTAGNTIVGNFIGHVITSFEIYFAQVCSTYTKLI